MDKKNIIVIGYYGHGNIGDEQYIYTFESIFKNDFNVKYIDCDNIKNEIISERDIIVLGGGDILNNYFMNQIINIFQSKKNKIIALSVGIPYTDIILHSEKLNIIDYIFIRTKQDFELFNKYYHSTRIFYIPDISYFLLQYNFENKDNKFNDLLLNLKNNTNNRKIISISLNRHIYNSDYSEQYNDIITTFAKFIIYLIKLNYHVIFIPFNTNTLSDNENDLIIHKDVCNLIQILSNDSYNYITYIDFTLTPFEILELYKIVYINIPMRYHSCLFSIYKKLPFLPIFTTRKIKNLLLDTHWNYGYQLDVNDKDIPLSLDINILISRFLGIVDNISVLNTKLSLINKTTDIDIKSNIENISYLLNNDYPKINLETNNTRTINNKINIILTKVQNFSISNGFLDFRLINNIKLQNIIVKIVSYCITNNTYSKYNHGLFNKMFTINYNFIEEWKWIILDYKEPSLVNNPYGLFNIGFIDQKDYSGAHRSGWQYVYDNIKYLHSDKATVFLDLSIDKSFHWNFEINKILGIIPYTKPWMGFLHHTFEHSFSKYNNYNLLENSDFIKSLEYCRGIFVMSKNLQSLLIKNLNDKHIYTNVYFITHPTEINVPQFSLSNFIKNTDKKIVHIGGWLRNIFSFYNMILYPNFKCNTNCFGSNIKYSLSKVSLKGANMDNYYPSSFFSDKLFEFLAHIKNNDENTKCMNVSQNIQELHNNWYKHYYNYTSGICTSVKLIEKLSNADYDNLLIQNIVFINLVDASAVNTLIECVVRNTPIIINRHPAVVEILGDDYPLFYGDKTGICDNYTLSNSINILLNNPNIIPKSYKYLKSLDKTKLNITYFIKTLIQYF